MDLSLLCREVANAYLEKLKTSYRLKLNWNGWNYVPYIHRWRLVGGDI